MISYLPEIYPDELVYSWFCRYYVHSACYSNKMALNDLYCKRSDNPNKEFIGHLNEQAKGCIEKMCPIKELILQHTMFPQYARFIPLEQKKKALDKLSYEHCDVHHLFCVLPRCEEEQFLRYCPLCVKEDRERYGEAYWHRKHQIRNLGICTKHNCKLILSNVSAKSQLTFTFAPAEENVTEDTVIVQNNSITIAYANYLVQVFESVMDFNSNVPLSAILYDGMSKTKYLKSSGRSRYTKLLADDMRAFYEEIELHNIASIHQIQRALLGDRFDFSVVCQIAFFLKMKVEELVKPKLSMVQIQQEQNSHYMKDKDNVDWKELDDETVPILEQIAKNVYYGTVDCRPERVSEKLAYRELNLMQHRLENMPKCRAVLKRYEETYAETWARRIIWAYRKLEQENKVFYWSDIRILAGVKKCNFQSVIPYLYKHTDERMVKTLIEMVGD